MADINVTYQVYTGDRWLPNVTNLTDYAGIYGQAIQGVYASLSRGSIQYRTHTQGGDWLPWVTDRTDYAGSLGKNVDGLQMQLVDLSGYNVRYRAYVGGRWLPWVTGATDYAGIFGQPIEGIQVEIVSGSSGGGGGEILPPVPGGRKVFIDPGHGGNDPGAIGNGMNEKDIVLEISKKVGNILTQKGVTVEYSRTNDTYVSLDGRAQMANNWGASLFVSIHSNSFGDSSARGTECFTYPTADSQNKKLSANVASAISSKLGLINRGIKKRILQY
ncbi:MAG: N-acetylmuramoyl-L-alanine amidase [Bacilli bacterium]